jgi:hypothetical protein
MTCILAISNGKRVLIGGDTAGSAVDGKEVYSFPEASKIFVTGPYAVGFTTSYRAGQILRYGVEWPEPPADAAALERFLVVDLVDALRGGLKAGGWERTHEGVVSGAQIVIGLGAAIFMVTQDYAVLPMRFAAIGNGRLPAYGALHVTEGLEMPLSERAHLALQAAEAYVPGVRAPFSFVSTSEPGEPAVRVRTTPEHSS